MSGGGPAGQADAARLSIIIVHRNGPEILLRTLAAVAAAVDPVSQTTRSSGSRVCAAMLSNCLRKNAAPFNGR